MLKLVMGLLSIALLCSIILMLTESFGFILEVIEYYLVIIIRVAYIPVEYTFLLLKTFYFVLISFLQVFVFTLMGGLVNAGSATQYVLLVFWFVLYANVCYKRVYDRFVLISMNKSSF